MDRKKKCTTFAYFPWWANGPYSAGLGRCAGVIAFWLQLLDSNRVRVREVAGLDTSKLHGALKSMIDEWRQVVCSAGAS